MDNGDIYPSVCYANSAIDLVETHKHLRVMLTQDTKWTEYISISA